MAEEDPAVAWGAEAEEDPAAASAVVAEEDPVAASAVVAEEGPAAPAAVVAAAPASDADRGAEAAGWAAPVGQAVGDTA